ncbi:MULTISPECIES: phage virion morphogenesis protein [unclassified Neisseria]|uniref:phage virion morphogenesis protein n=1 Tax=unclassified Neisseria TaxID=2623750 RepID=UPI001072A3E4|nr:MULTISPECIES: phage virion morphogenesis protein [unclassified Neisseria]MBF0804964.1 phage virion morphogenesis protein [Neisseria sp. 19428wB4_WF04]TFU39311.1 phage virion morphogenesis protein [Neisseria sp. WF04]
MKLTVESTLPELQAHLNTLHARLNGDLKEPLNAVAGLLENSTRKRFETKTAPDGRKWAPLKLTTLYAKTGKNGKTRGSILVDRGDLLKSITSHATESMAEVGTDRVYARYLQTGTADMPAREIFGLSGQDRSDIRAELAGWLHTIWSDT